LSTIIANRADQGPLQTRVLEINLKAAPQVNINVSAVLF